MTGWFSSIEKNFSWIEFITKFQNVKLSIKTRNINGTEELRTLFAS